MRMSACKFHKSIFSGCEAGLSLYSLQLALKTDTDSQSYTSVDWLVGRNCKFGFMQIPVSSVSCSIHWNFHSSKHYCKTLVCNWINHAFWPLPIPCAKLCIARVSPPRTRPEISLYSNRQNCVWRKISLNSFSISKRSRDLSSFLSVSIVRKCQLPLVK